ncbi:MAG: hypothetical protein LBI89_03235 [Prevotellaceae bacterium]|jgi:hypothetical protein|nr:hypothetical protein [Prevotellaceae bacterium]
MKTIIYLFVLLLMGSSNLNDNRPEQPAYLTGNDDPVAMACMTAPPDYFSGNDEPVTCMPFVAPYEE